MPLKTVPTTRLPSGKTGIGRRVQYRDAKGIMRAATVVGAGSTSGVKLAVDSYRSSGDSSKHRARGTNVIDNVAKATSMKSVNAYFYWGDSDDQGLMTPSPDGKIG